MPNSTFIILPLVTPSESLELLADERDKHTRAQFHDPLQQQDISHSALIKASLDFSLRPSFVQRSLGLIRQGVPGQAEELQRQIHLDRYADDLRPHVAHLSENVIHDHKNGTRVRQAGN